MNQMRKVIAVLAFTFAGCHSQSPQKTAAPPSAPVAPARQEEVVKCASGKQVQIIKGECAGKWRIGTQDGKSVCEFEWGPPVRCPQGTKSYGFEAVCYGVTVKPFIGAASQATAETCFKTYGKVPMLPQYEMKCCPL